MNFPSEVRTPDGISWFRDQGHEPIVANLSDIHGYLDAARDALTAVGDTDEYPPIVETDDTGRLHWADKDYVLLVNGDLVDRGPANDACVALVQRLMREAPPGRVRYHLGNHEMAILFPELFRWPGTYSVELAPADRRAFVGAVAAGHVPAAFSGYDYTYTHAGATEPIDVGHANDVARAAATDLLDAIDQGRDTAETQRRIVEDHATVYGLGGTFGRGADAGILWMDFEHMSSDAPPQIVGHTRQKSPTRTGRAICANTLRANLVTEGGECVVLESPAGVDAVVRQPNGPELRQL